MGQSDVCSHHQKEKPGVVAVGHLEQTHTHSVSHTPTHIHKHLHTHSLHVVLAEAVTRRLDSGVHVDLCEPALLAS